MLIRINNLFGKYNYVVDFDKKINILIGENGIGKSTILKIVNCILNYDYISLINFYFDSIDIEDDDDKITINYTDLVIDNNYLIRKYVGDKDYDIYREAREDYDAANEKNPIDLNYYISFDGWNSNEEKYAFEVLYDNYCFEDFLKKLDNRLLYKILKFDEKLLFNEKIVISYEMVSCPGGSSTFIEFIKETYNNAEKNISDGIYFINSNIANTHSNIKNIISKSKYNNILLIDMASDFNVVNDFNKQYGSNALEIDAICDEYKALKLKSNKLNFVFMPLEDKYPNLKKEDFIKKLKSTYRINRGNGIDGKNLDFGNYLFNKIYDEKLIEEFKNDLYDFLYENISNVKNFKVYSKVKDSTFNKLRFYIKPLLDKNNIFFSKLTENWNTDFYADSSSEFILLTAFYQKYKDKYVEIKNDKLIKLNDLFKKYFVNKQVVATPFGIVISSSDFENDIYFEELSAGEKKLIILFTISILSDDLIILLDEPENSLSVVWQKELLSDIITNAEYKQLIVATQSPFIVSNDDLVNYLTCLPMEEKNE